MQFRLPKLQIKDALISAKVLAYNKKHDDAFEVSLDRTLQPTRSPSPRHKPRRGRLTIAERKMMQQRESHNVKVFQQQLKMLIERGSPTSSFDSSVVPLAQEVPQPAPVVEEHLSNRASSIKKVTINDERTMLQTPEGLEVHSPKQPPVMVNRFRRFNSLFKEPPQRMFFRKQFSDMEEARTVRNSRYQHFDKRMTVSLSPAHQPSIDEELLAHDSQGTIQEFLEVTIEPSIDSVQQEHIADTSSIHVQQSFEIRQHHGSGELPIETINESVESGIQSIQVSVDQSKESPQSQKISNHEDTQSQLTIESHQIDIVSQTDLAVSPPPKKAESNIKLTLHDQFQMTRYLKMQLDVKAKFFQEGETRYASQTSVELAPGSAQSSNDRARTIKSRTTATERYFENDQLDQSQHNSTKVDFTLSQKALINQKWKANMQLYHSFAKKLRTKIHQERINQLNPAIRDKNTLLISHLFKNYASFMKYLHIRELNKLIILYSETMGICQELDSCRTFVQMTIMLGEHFFDIHDYNKSTFFLRQSLISCHLFDIHAEAIEALITLSKISNRLKQYTQSVALLKRALEYAWYISNHNLELQIYDALGVSCYYSGAVHQAELFHMKFMTGYHTVSENKHD